MYMRAFVYRFVYVSVLTVGIAVAAAFQQPVAHAAAAQAGSKPAAVSTALPIVTLSTVHVHAESARTPVAKPAAPAPVAAASEVTVSSAATDHRSGGLAPTLRLDMPYYSFGKLLPRVGKE